MLASACPAMTLAIDTMRKMERPLGSTLLLGRLRLLGFLRDCDSRSSGLSTLAIMPVATRV
jgi:hypothetical protein